MGSRASSRQLMLIQHSVVGSGGNRRKHSLLTGKPSSHLWCTRNHSYNSPPQFAAASAPNNPVETRSEAGLMFRFSKPFNEGSLKESEPEFFDGWLRFPTEG